MATNAWQDTPLLRASQERRRASGQFSLLVKPAGADCNLNCAYCFYRGARRLYGETDSQRMTGEVLQRVVSSYLGTSQPCYGFGWQGGEPTLMGVEFFRAVTRLQTEHGRPGSVVVNAVQTNGTLITDEMAGLWAEYRFLVGVSVDGPRPLHDRYRRDEQGAPSHRSVMAGVERLRRAGVRHNAMVLVTDANVRQAAKVYDYLVAHGFDSQQYIPCVEYGPGGELLPCAVDADAWGDFLCALFRRWYPRDVGRVSVRLFDELVARLGGGDGSQCTMAPACGGSVVVEHNGDVFPCDFQVRSDTRLGNIMDQDWDDIVGSARYLAFRARKGEFHPSCGECEFLSLCGADCPKSRGSEWRSSSAERSVLCEGWKRFFTIAVPRLEELGEGGAPWG